MIRKLLQHHFKLKWASLLQLFFYNNFQWTALCLDLINYIFIFCCLNFCYYILLISQHSSQTVESQLYLCFDFKLLLYRDASFYLYHITLYHLINVYHIAIPMVMFEILPATIPTFHEYQQCLCVFGRNFYSVIHTVVLFQIVLPLSLHIKLMFYFSCTCTIVIINK